MHPLLWEVEEPLARHIYLVRFYYTLITLPFKSLMAGHTKVSTSLREREVGSSHLCKERKAQWDLGYSMCFKIAPFSQQGDHLLGRSCYSSTETPPCISFSMLPCMTAVFQHLHRFHPYCVILYFHFLLCGFQGQSFLKSSVPFSTPRRASHGNHPDFCSWLLWVKPSRGGWKNSARIHLKGFPIFHVLKHWI